MRGRERETESEAETETEMERRVEKVKGRKGENKLHLFNRKEGKRYSVDSLYMMV